jgi:hypothetical protein
MIFNFILIFLHGTTPSTPEPLILLRYDPQKRSEFEIRLFFAVGFAKEDGMVFTPVKILT